MPSKQPHTYHLGSFRIETGTIWTADPSYPINSRGMIRMNRIACGEWNAEIEVVDVPNLGKRVSVLTIQHVLAGEIDWNWFGDVYNDSGLIGFIDVEQYGPDTPGWFDALREKTLRYPYAGVLPGGVVSQSGLGGGDYGVYGALAYQDDPYFHNGEVVGLKVIFIEGYDAED